MNGPQHVFVVMGQIGIAWWIVGVFQTAEAAQQLVQRAWSQLTASSNVTYSIHEKVVL